MDGGNGKSHNAEFQGFIRVDDRLVHGQTIHYWCTHYNTREIILVDDDTYNNPIKKMFLEMSVPNNNILKILNLSLFVDFVKDTEAELDKAGRNVGKSYLEQPMDKNRLIIFAKLGDLKTVLCKIEESKGLTAGFPDWISKRITVGSISKRLDRIQLAQGVYCNDEEIGILEFVREKGFGIEFKTVP